MTFFNLNVPMDVGQAMCFASAFNSSGNRLAVAGEDSTIRIYYPEDNFKRGNVPITAAMTEKRELKMPIMSLKFRPGDPNQLLMAATCDGSVSFWHLGASKLVSSFREEGNGIETATYSPSGSTLATAGTDCRVRIYDTQHNNALHSTLYEGPTAEQPNAHISRIQSITFADDNILLSGGWDRLVNIWDLRGKSRPIGTIAGPYLCGDGLTVRNNFVICASSERTEEQLEMFDLRTLQRVAQKSFVSAEEGIQPPSLFMARFSPTDNIVAVGGARYMGLFDITQGKLVELSVTGNALPTAFTACWDHSGRRCFFGGRGGCVLEKK